MKITKSQLKKLIKEELSKALREDDVGDPIWPLPKPELSGVPLQDFSNNNLNLFLEFEDALEMALEEVFGGLGNIPDHIMGLSLELQKKVKESLMKLQP